MNQPNLDRLLKSVARTFYLSLTYLPKSIREPMSLAYLLARLSDTIVDEQTVPWVLRLETLSDLRRCVEEPKNPAHIQKLQQSVRLCLSFFKHQDLVLLQNTALLLTRFYAQASAIQSLIQEVLLHIFAGQKMDLTYFDHLPEIVHFKTEAELDRYLYLVAGSVGEFWTKLGALCIPEFSREKAEVLLPKAVDFGKALQLTNILKDIPHDLLQGRCYLPIQAHVFSEADRLHKHASALKNQLISAYPTLIDHWRDQALSYLKSARVYTQAMHNRRIRFSVMVPMQLAYKTLFALPVKLSKKAVYFTLMQALFQTYCPFLRGSRI